jgi:hypothetical protein
MIRRFEQEAREGMMFALKERPSPATEPMAKLKVTPARAAFEPKYGEFDLEAAMDEVMDRFPKALEHLAK